MLVAACSDWPPADRRAESIRNLAAGNLDWDRVVRMVIRHRVAGLVYEGLSNAGTAITMILQAPQWFPACDGFGGCSLSLVKDVVWSAIWPVYWTIQNRWL